MCWGRLVFLPSSWSQPPSCQPVHSWNSEHDRQETSEHCREAQSCCSPFSQRGVPRCVVHTLLMEKLPSALGLETPPCPQAGDLTEGCRSELLPGVSVRRYEVACDGLVISSVGTGGERELAVCPSDTPEPTHRVGPAPLALEPAFRGFTTPG